MAGRAEPEFSDQLKVDRAASLRRRITAYCIAIGAVFLADDLTTPYHALSPDGRRGYLMEMAMGAALYVAIGALCVWIWRRGQTLRSLERTSRWIVVGCYLFAIAFGLMLTVFARAYSADLDRLFNGTSTRPAPPGNDLLEASSTGIWIPYLFACVIMGWTGREALRPLAVILPVHVAICLATLSVPWDGRKGHLVSGLAAAGLGLLAAWLMRAGFMQRFRRRAVEKQYVRMRAELSEAARLVQPLFPEPLREGPFRLEFAYRPLSDIGGDFLFIHRSPEGAPPSLSMILTDINGHGVPAAMNITRVHDSLEDHFAQRPAASPGETLTMLNACASKRLSSTNVFVTVLALRVRLHETGDATLEWASGGHPPALVLRAARSAGERAVIERLGSTAPMLGVCEPAEFSSAERTTVLRPGDVLVAYTDGASEARSEGGALLGIEGLERALATLAAADAAPAAAVNRLTDAADGHRFGPARDDMMVVGVGLAVGAPTPSN